MKRYLMSVPAFAGDAEVIYNQHNKLIRIDVSKTNITPEILEEFKQRVPVLASTMDDIKACFQRIKLTIQEADVEITFELFWKKYDKKVNRKRCLPIWNKLTSSEKLKAYLGVDQYHRYLKTEAKNGFNRGKLDPENYLKNETWNNEYR